MDISSNVYWQFFSEEYEDLEVCPAKHALENGTEVCTCTFVVFWQHGPNAGLTTSATIENICLIKHGSVETDPALSSFMELSRKKRDKDGSGRSAPKDGPCCTQSCGPYVNSDSSRSYKNSEEELQILEQPDTTMQTFIGKRSNGTKRMRQDTDLGGDSFSSEDLKGASRKYFILIENMEKDTSASMIVNFIYQETSTLCQALVLPSTLSEAHTRGAIFIENQEKFNRPWVITGNKWSLETFGSMTPKSEEQIWKKDSVLHYLLLLFFVAGVILSSPTSRCLTRWDPILHHQLIIQ
ncbi:hypothetical protein MRB53_011362 [Persea americana]|uniref:Uncharacterized protein n=1 Tax=Persea americana TaxID=3435 RepID=A0ACC2LUK5_PERAE|nr:hypothetical protein MRB53_011362 [Persea americana]